MTEFRYSERVIAFALANDGIESLSAKCELEIEKLERREIGQGNGAQFWMHVFSWHGENNLLMMPDVGLMLRGEPSLGYVFIDMIDDDGDPEVKHFPQGPEPDMPDAATLSESV